MEIPSILISSGLAIFEAANIVGNRSVEDTYWPTTLFAFILPFHSIIAGTRIPPGQAKGENIYIYIYSI